jgi:hypothetical protein
MDQRIEAFLGDVLALAGEEPDAVRRGRWQLGSFEGTSDFVCCVNWVVEKFRLKGRQRRIVEDANVGVHHQRRRCRCGRSLSPSMDDGSNKTRARYSRDALRDLQGLARGCDALSSGAAVLE